jgi:hypothetical protein
MPKKIGFVGVGRMGELEKSDVPELTFKGRKGVKQGE